MRFFALLLLAFVGIVSAQLPNAGCTLSAGSNKYDLRGAMSSSDYAGQPDPGSNPPNSFYFSPCKNSVTCSNSSAPGSPTVSPVCQVDGGGSYHGCGLIASVQNGELHPAGSGFWIFYDNGDSTKYGPRQVNITCVCGKKFSLGPFPTAGSNGYEYQGSDVGNVYGMQFVHPACCPGGAASGGFDYGWIFVVIVCGGAVMYLIVGVILNRFMYGAEGIQMIPHSEFWASAPGLMKDGVMYIVHKVRGTSGYNAF